MQQTKTYKLNLIETSDTFSPNPLNENMEKLEAVITAGADAGAEADAALEQRVIALEGHKFAVGTYVGNGNALTISLGFTPEYVIIQPGNNVPQAVIRSSSYGGFVIQTDGFIANSSWSYKNTVYTYLAIC